jgi:hypothetical protein
MERAPRCRFRGSGHRGWLKRAIEVRATVPGGRKTRVWGWATRGVEVHLFL